MSVLSRASRCDVRTDPFPHVVVEEALDRDAYAALASSFPSAEIIAGSGARPGSNRRYSLPAWALMLHGGVDPVWKAFVERHVSDGFLHEVAALFDGHWGVNLPEESPGLLYRDSHRDHRVLADVRIEINTPVVGRPSTPRGAHLDTPNRLYSGLFYLRAEEDDSVGGDLELLRWRSQPSGAPELFELPSAAVECVATIPYRANQFVLFPQSISALHGVGVRHPTPHVRRYVFITAEIEEDWLMPEGGR